MEDTQVIANKTEEKNGYNAVVIGTGERKLKNISKPERGQFTKVKLEPKAQIKEFRVSAEGLVEVGANISVSHFVAGQKVDVTATSIGKGFAGAMKRHNFGGLEATHGISISHRSHGSTGQCQEPGRVFKGKKMAGQMGNKQVTIQSLEIVETDVDENLIIVKGAVPGAKGSIVAITDSVKHERPENAPFPAGRKSIEADIKAAEEEAVAVAKAEEEAAEAARAEELAKAEAKAREEAAAAGDDAGSDAPAAEAKEESKEEENKDES